jgi:ABC-type glutathione transport system ATPase component
MRPWSSTACVLTGSTAGKEDLVTGLSFELTSGSALALVGESGSGKSLSALALVGLLPAGVHVAAGRITLFGRPTTS